ncbi:hypothetical protein [Ferruginibacter albus]|uniref:hypothetical protein n=1 Tax=Ferruginibacter albus TaxID=2875540 RepID=UPI001CC80A50|nr:hypothetical protein [Ferruginibacter albus]UAY52139.1 hypothetical protein K9M53_00245 [Ferruginibacter albus]
MQNNQRIRGYAEWLNLMKWSYYCTFTTRYDFSVKSARVLMNRYFSFLKNNLKSEVQIFWVAEPFDTKDGCHLHTLIKVLAPGSSAKNQINKVWQVITNGNYGKGFNSTKIDRYKPYLGAHFYVSKYLNRINADYDFLF